MAALDVTNVIAIEFISDTVVTAPDGNTFTALAGTRYGVPANQTSMTVSVAGDYNCMTKGARSKDNVMVQAFTVDEVRSAA